MFLTMVEVNKSFGVSLQRCEMLGHRKVQIGFQVSSSGAKEAEV